MTHLLAQRSRTDRAFERLYRQHVREVYRYALAVLRSPEDAEDVTQTAFLNAYRACERGERPRSARNWLIAIAHELCQQRVRQEARLQGGAYEEHLEETVPDEEPPTQEDVRRALGNLAFNERAALVMREVEGRSYAEIAEKRAISRRLDDQLARAERRPLRRHLRGCGDCARFDHSQRTQRAALRSLANVPLPSSLSSFFAAAGAGVGSTSKA